MKPTERFTGRAGAYAAGRPAYPPAAIDALLEGLGNPRELLAVDLGAGTGISSRLLADRGVAVLAVEPNASMRDAAEAHPRVTFVDATAEDTGVGEAEADLVVAFQAFHWFDERAALDEMVRILRPGGRAAVVYNERDESDPVTREFGTIVRKYATDDAEALRARMPDTFTAFPAWQHKSIRTFPHAYTLDRDGLRARVESTSYLPNGGPAGEALFAEIDAFAAAHPDGFTMRMLAIVASGDAGAG